MQQHHASRRCCHERGAESNVIEVSDHVGRGGNDKSDIMDQSGTVCNIRMVIHNIYSDRIVPSIPDHQICKIRLSLMLTNANGSLTHR